MGAYSIRDLERLSGIKAHTIRIWEKRYGLIEPHRTNTNIRTYCDSELKKLLNVSMLNRSGIKISKIAGFTQEEITDKINQLTNVVSDVESQIEGLTIAMIEFDEIKFERILSRSIIQNGFEKTIIQLIYPFLVKIGLMWQTSAINPAREHFITNLIRQKVIVAIDGQINAVNEDAGKLLFFLPEGEMHEIGILFFAYLAKNRGHQVIYLGQSVPTADIAEMVSVRSFDALITAFVSSINNKSILSYIEILSEKTGHIPLLISGLQTENLTGELPQNVTVISSPGQFVNELGKMTGRGEEEVNGKR
ncbi:MAG: MerR family transcriptional regulator [Bacteroidales bacterium]|nr:MerR family transcriptional regulator [Bacteroidales bacterium]MBN2763209.1 MerR family transcriptional regulator [Bacteroidales bacterium]